MRYEILIAIIASTAFGDIGHKDIIETKRVPQEVVEKKKGHYFIDFGKAAFGTIELDLKAEKKRTVEVHFGETLAHEHSIHRDPPGTIRHRRARIQVYPGKGRYRVKVPPDGRNTKSRAIKMPEHIGEVVPFRYCEIIGAPSPVDAKDISMVMAHYPFDDTASFFESSDATLNAVWELCKYSIKATSFCGLYVDGDRERRPYEADAYINQLSHYCVDDEYGMARRTQEHFMDHPTWPTEWLLHSPLMAWAEYLYTGKIGFARDNFAELELRTLGDLARSDGLISTRDGRIDDKLLDALNLPKPPRDIVDWPRGERDGYDFRNYNTVVNAFHYRALVVMAKLAEALGREKDALGFTARAEKVYKSFNEVFWDPENRVYVDGEGSSHSSLHANMFPLAFDLVPQNRKNPVIEFVKSRGMACSVYGSQYLLEALYKNGQEEYALDLLSSHGKRSWWNMIESGSTITLEAWDRDFKGNLDWNHAWGAAPANIIPRFLMGVRPLEPGFDKVLVEPRLDGLSTARLRIPTPLGPVRLAIDRNSKDIFKMELEIPEGSSALVTVPRGEGNATEVMVNGKPRKAKTDGERLRLDLPSGEWDLVRGAGH